MNRLVPALLVSTALLAACSGSAGVGSRPSPTSSHAKVIALPRQVQAVVRTDHGPSGLLVGHDAIFVANHRGGTIQRIDPNTNRIIATVTVGGQLVLEESTASGGLDAIDERTTSLWACSNTDGALHQVDPRTMRETATLSAQCDGGWRTRVGDNLWAVPGPDTRNLLIVGLRTAKVLHRVPLGDPGPGWGAAVSTGDRVLIGAGQATPVLSTVGRVLKRLPVGTPWITSAGGRVYRIPEDGTLAELDPKTLTVRRTFHVPPHHDGDPVLVADGSGHLYYRPDYTHVYTVDRDSGSVQLLLTLPWSETPTAMAWAFDSLWVTNFDADTIWRIDPGA